MVTHSAKVMVINLFQKTHEKGLHWLFNVLVFTTLWQWRFHCALVAKTFLICTSSFWWPATPRKHLQSSWYHLVPLRIEPNWFWPLILPLLAINIGSKSFGNGKRWSSSCVCSTEKGLFLLKIKIQNGVLVLTPGVVSWKIYCKSSIKSIKSIYRVMWLYQILLD